MPEIVIPAFFKLLADLEDGKELLIIPNKLQCSCGRPTYIPQGFAPLAAIGCGDGAEISDSIDELEIYYAKLAEQSSFADVWPVHALCTGWKVRPAERFAGISMMSKESNSTG